MTDQQAITARLAPRSWVPAVTNELVTAVAAHTATAHTDDVDHWLHALVEDNRLVHERYAVNLNPATNTMNPRAEALLAARLGTRPSLGYPGDKYETGLEAIERIEVIAAELAAEVFDADHVEIRVPSGAMANLIVFMAVARPGDAIVVPPATIAGHVTHHRAGAAGLYGLHIHEAPVDAARYTVDVDQLATLVRRVRPTVITLGQSLNLSHHPVDRVRAVADSVGAMVLFDAAHLSGPIAGGTWPNPLAQGAHIMTMSTYKSLGGPPGGLVVTNDPGLAQRVETIAFPGLTANFDVAKTAALAITLLDWKAEGHTYATQMTATARALAAALADRGVPVYAADAGATLSHAFAVDVAAIGGGTIAARWLRSANLLTSAIGLPHRSDAGLRMGTNEITRWGATPTDMDELAALIERALRGSPEHVADDVTAWRQRFTALHHIRSAHGSRARTPDHADRGPTGAPSATPRTRTTPGPPAEGP